MPDFFLAKLSFQADLSFEQVGLFADALGDLACATSWKESGARWECLWTLEGSCSHDLIRRRLEHAVAHHALPDIDVSALTIEPMPDINWLAESYAGFTPFSLGPFFIYGHHHRGKTAMPPDALALEIDAATAFGSGEHGTTAGCLLALEALHARGFHPASFLDMGTGSGILAIAAALRWPDITGYAVDNDPECIAVTNRHKDANAITDQQITAYVSEGCADHRVRAQGPYDLVMANILAGPLIDMAQDLAEVTAAPGFLILSGLLTAQQEDVIRAYEAAGMHLVDSSVRGEWAILVLARKA